MKSKVKLKLYVIGGDMVSEQAITDLRNICNSEFAGQYELEIIDILEYPQLAEDEKILAVPTVLKLLPAPMRRIIGSLENKKKVLLGLGLYNMDGAIT